MNKKKVLGLLLWVFVLNITCLADAIIIARNYSGNVTAVNPLQVTSNIDTLLGSRVIADYTFDDNNTLDNVWDDRLELNISVDGYGGFQHYVFVSGYDNWFNRSAGSLSDIFFRATIEGPVHPDLSFEDPNVWAGYAMGEFSFHSGRISAATTSWVGSIASLFFIYYTDETEKLSNYAISYELQEVPEPTAMLLLGVGLVSLVCLNGKLK